MKERKTAAPGEDAAVQGDRPGWAGTVVDTA